MSLVFDIGSNVGLTIEIFQKKFDKVVGFEPNPQLHNFLREKFKDTNLIVDRRAISHQKGSQEFKIANANTISTLSNDWVENSRFTNNYNWNHKIIVETLTLQDAIDEYGIPDYVKIDTEGYEYEILTNFHTLLPNTLFAFEWAEEQKEKIEKTLTHLHTLGYDSFGYTEADPILYDDEIEWFNYKNFKLIDKLDSNRKSLWGMIYFKN